MTRWSSTGLDPVEEAALMSLRSLGCAPDTPHQSTSRVLAAVAEEHGYAPDDVHRRILQLCRPWLTGLRTIDFHGNVGARSFDAAHPRYTELRLTALGVACAEAAAGDGPPIPAGLVHGDLFKGGTRPPLDPPRLLAALRARHAGATDAQVLDLVGPPTFPAGCEVAGDLAALHAGTSTRIRLRAVLEVDEGRVAIRALPPEVSEAEICLRLHEVAGAHARRPDRALPIADVDDRSRWEAMEIVVRPAPGTTADELAERLYEVWGIEVLRDCQYPKPLADLLAEWIVHPDADAGLDRFASLIP